MCKLYHQAQDLHDQGVHVVSVDEKTGIQTLERVYPMLPMQSGKIESIEFEYQRHGTQTLIANTSAPLSTGFEVATGQVICPSVGDTRTEEDFTAHIVATLETNPKAEWITSTGSAQVSFVIN